MNAAPLEARRNGETQCLARILIFCFLCTSSAIPLYFSVFSSFLRVYLGFSVLLRELQYYQVAGLRQFLLLRCRLYSVDIVLACLVVLEAFVAGNG